MSIPNGGLGTPLHITNPALLREMAGSSSGTGRVAKPGTSPYSRERGSCQMGGPYLNPDLKRNKL